MIVVRIILGVLAIFATGIIVAADLYLVYLLLGNEPLVW